MPTSPSQKDPPTIWKPSWQDNLLSYCSKYDFSLHKTWSTSVSIAQGRVWQVISWCVITCCLRTKRDSGRCLSLRLSLLLINQVDSQCSLQLVATLCWVFSEIICGCHPVFNMVCFQCHEVNWLPLPDGRHNPYS